MKFVVVMYLYSICPFQPGSMIWIGGTLLVLSLCGVVSLMYCFGRLILCLLQYIGVWLLAVDINVVYFLEIEWYWKTKCIVDENIEFLCLQSMYRRAAGLGLWVSFVEIYLVNCALVP
jgi:hypothetical protein